MKMLPFQGEGDRIGCWMHSFQGPYEYRELNLIAIVRLVGSKLLNSYITQPEGSRYLPLKGLNPELWVLWRAPAIVYVIWSYHLQKISWVLGRSVKMSKISAAQTWTESPVSHPRREPALAVTQLFAVLLSPHTGSHLCVKCQKVGRSDFSAFLIFWWHFRVQWNSSWNHQIIIPILIYLKNPN